MQIKPRNHVVIALSNSRRHSGAHCKNRRVELEKEIDRETEEEMADRLDYIENKFEAEYDYYI